MLDLMLDTDDLRPDKLRPITRREYYALGETGAFDGQRVELLYGQIVAVSPIGTRHARMTVWLNRYLCTQLSEAYAVHPALPFIADEYSEPEPDMMVVRADVEFAEHPTSALLIIELADSSLRKDRMIKARLYAEAGVPEYWIVNLSKAGEVSVEVYTRPSASGYAQMTTVGEGEVLRPTLVPLEIPVAALPR